jgi:hypothetical protein
MWGFLQLVGEKGRFQVKQRDSTFVSRMSMLRRGEEM